MNQSTQRLVTLLALAGSLGLTLTACVPVIMGGAVMGTAMVASDRRTSGAQLEDTGIELRSGNRIQEALGDRAHINVTSFNRRALITGEVPTAQDKQQVEQIVLKVDNVQSAVNELTVLGNSSLTQRSSDALITGRVKASMVDSKDLFANAFKVVTERGNVYLMGRVTQREADRATEIARTTSGVLKVVRVFEIITEDELRQMQPKPAPVETKTP